MAAGEFTEPAPQAVTLHNRGAVSWDDETDPGVSALVGEPSKVEKRCPTVLAQPQHRSDLRCPVESPAPWEPLAAQRPPCLDGNWTASRFRPFLRRRLRIARPQRVCIRARNPCLLERRLLRGRYVGFIRNSRYTLCLWGRKASCDVRVGSRLTFPHGCGTFGRPFEPPTR